MLRAHAGTNAVRRGTASDLLGVAAAAGNVKAAAITRQQAIARAIGEAREEADR